ncbi:MAG: hypothetical protein WC120_05325 [Parcubacteria group bacterium]|jgi:hypothetical protein
MPYSLRWIDEHTKTLLADIPRFRQVAENAIGIIGEMHSAFGIDATALSECINYDETGQLREIVDEYSRRRVEGIEKSLFALASGEITASSQRVTAMMAVLNNRHPGYGMQRVSHSGTVSYAAPATQAPEDIEGPAVLKLFKSAANGPAPDKGEG